jgi:hypothetical protein
VLVQRSRPASALACSFAEPGALALVGTAFQWSAAAGATGYVIKWGTSAATYTYTANVGNVLTYPYASLPLSQNLTYFMACFSTDGVDESVASNEIQVRNGAQIA